MTGLSCNLQLASMKTEQSATTMHDRRCLLDCPPPLTKRSAVLASDTECTTSSLRTNDNAFMHAVEYLLCLAQISLLASKETKQWTVPTGLTGSTGRGHPPHPGGTLPLHPGAVTGIAIAPSHPSSAPPVVIMLQSQSFLGLAGSETSAACVMISWLRSVVVCASRL